MLCKALSTLHTFEFLMTLHCSSNSGHLVFIRYGNRGNLNKETFANQASILSLCAFPSSNIVVDRLHPLNHLDAPYAICIHQNRVIAFIFDLHFFFCEGERLCALLESSDLVIATTSALFLANFSLLRYHNIVRKDGSRRGSHRLFRRGATDQ